MGYSGDPSYVIQSLLYSGFHGLAPNRDPNGIMTMSVNDLSTYLNSNWTPSTNIVNNYFNQFFNGHVMPSTIDGFVDDLVDYVNTQLGSGTIPDPAGNNQIKSYLLEMVKDALMLETPNPDGSVMANALSALPPGVLTDIYEQAFNKFLREFQYDGTTLNGNTGIINPPGTPARVQMSYFADRFNEFFFKLASVDNTTGVEGVPGVGGVMLNFDDVFAAYFGNNPTAFEQFLANYINEVVYPANGKGQSFIPSQEIGAWLEKVQQAYSIALTGSGAPAVSSVGQTTRKVDILLSIYALLVEMIGTLQKVAAAQSDRLQLLSSWTAAYTNLQTQVPTFTAGDGTIFGGTYGNNTNTTNVAIQSRDDANSLNQTFTETIRSRRTQVDNSAKSLQNNLNQSNDSANQQSDAATTILQNLRSILSALYR